MAPTSPMVILPIKTDRDLAARSKWLFDFSDTTKLTLIGDYAEHLGNDGQAQRQIAGTTSLIGTPGLATAGISTAT